MMRSVKVDGADDPWNIKKDGDFIIGGVQFAPAKNVNLALNYRHKMFENEGADAVSAIYLNLEAKF